MAHLIGQGPAGAGSPTSEFGTTPFPNKVGSRMRDAEGNEYLYVDFTSTVYFGCLVQINSINQAAPLLGTANEAYRVGVVCGGRAVSDAGAHGTSDNGGWVQIYGVHPAVQTMVATDGGVSATAGGKYYCIPQTAVGTPTGVLQLVAQAAAVSIINTSTEGNVIHNMWVVDLGQVTDLTTWPGVSGSSGPTSVNFMAGDSTSGANTSAFIGQTYACFLNYPYVTGITVPLSDATS
jgi:hypothetical protein